MNQQQSQNLTITPAVDEQILVVKREKLFSFGAWQGINAQHLESYLTIIEKEQEFLPRSLMEIDPIYKQIIPYLIFTHNDKYFLMQRQAKASEQRLKNKYSLGIGGHIRKEDMVSKNVIDWAQREFEEEVNYSGSYKVQPLGILNDDSNEVGLVHVGLVLLLQGDSANISVKSELKSGQLVSIAECANHYENLENWSQITLNFIKNI